MGYSGIFMNIGEYAMSDPNPWEDPPNPGATPNYDPIEADGNQRFLDDNVRAQIKAKHAADLILWANCDIVQRVIRAALDKAVPDIYKPNDVLGQLSFGNLDIRGIFTDLYTRYGQVTPDDIKKLAIHHCNLHVSCYKIEYSIERITQVLDKKSCNEVGPVSCVREVFKIFESTKQELFPNRNFSLDWVWANCNGDECIIAI
jgi:hypothetical protein